MWYISYVTVLLGLAGYGFHRLTILFLYWRHGKKRPMPDRNFEEMPMVTVQLPVFNEMHVVDRLLDSVAALDETVEISKAGAERLRDRGFDAECIHRTDRTGYKAGALENGMESAKGDYILILDADFVPNPDLLQETIHHFTNDKIALSRLRAIALVVSSPSMAPEESGASRPSSMPVVGSMIPSLRIWTLATALSLRDGNLSSLRKWKPLPSFL